MGKAKHRILDNSCHIEDCQHEAKFECEHCDNWFCDVHSKKRYVAKKIMRRECIKCAPCRFIVDENYVFDGPGSYVEIFTKFSNKLSEYLFKKR